MTTDALRIPLDYISPRLEGTFVVVKTKTGNLDTKIDLGEVDGGYVKVLSGLKMGDEIIR